MENHLHGNYLFQCPACRHHVSDSQIHEHIQNCDLYYQHSSHSMSYSSMRSSFYSSYNYNSHSEGSDSENQIPVHALPSATSSLTQSIAVCPVCYEHFHNTHNVPLLLPNCGHTICKLCLKEIQSKIEYVICPICRTKCKLEIKHLPINYAVLDLVEKMMSSKCLVHKMELVGYCKDDDKVLCGACVLEHRAHQCFLLTDPELYLLSETKKKVIEKDLEELMEMKQELQVKKDEIYVFLSQIEECVEVHSSNLEDAERKMVKDLQEGSKCCLMELNGMAGSGLIKKINSEFVTSLIELETRITDLTSKLGNFEELSTLEKLQSSQSLEKFQKFPSLTPIHDLQQKLTKTLNYSESLKKHSLNL